MNLIDFTANLFRHQEAADAFAANPAKALRDAGLPDATPEDVQALLPTVAESMPPDHPMRLMAEPDEAQIADPAARHYYQLQPGDQVIDGVAGQTILRPDGTNVTLGPNDYILQPDEKVYQLQPGDEVISGFNGMIIQHPDGSITDVGTDTTIVGQDEVFVGPNDPLDPRVTTTPEDLGGGLDPRVTTTPEDLGGGLDPRVTTTPEDLGGGLDPRVTTTPEDLGEEWTPYEPAMDWTRGQGDGSVIPTPGELGLGEDPRDSVGIDFGEQNPIAEDQGDVMIEETPVFECGTPEPEPPPPFECGTPTPSDSTGYTDMIG